LLPARSADLIVTGILILGVPLLIVSQWLALRWSLPTRQIFNGLAVGFATIVLVLRIVNLRAYRREVAFGLGLGLTILASVAVNRVPIAVAFRGSVPYVGIILFLFAGLVSRPSSRSVRHGATAGGLSTAVMGLIAIPQLVLGEPAYSWFGQDLPYPRWWERGRATGLVVNPGRLSQIGLIAMSLSPQAHFGAFWIGSGAAIAIAAGGARLGIAAAVGLGAVVLAFRSQPRTNRIWLSAIGAIALFGLIQAVLPAAREDLVDRTETVFDELQQENGIPDDVRVANMRASLDAWGAYPILGTGPGRFGSTTAWSTQSPLHDRFGLPDVRSEEFLKELRERGDDREIDVGTAQLDLGWFQILSELGLLGILGFLTVLGSVVVRSIRERNVVPTALLFVLAVVSLGGPGLVDLSLASVVLFWVGATLSASLRAEPQESS
jgi:hypothetical protein